MFDSVINIEGVGEEVVFSIISLTVVLIILTYYFMKNQTRLHVVHPDERENVDLLRQSMDVVPRRRFSHQNNCPICLNDMQYETETNCGHIFCCRCWLAYRTHGNYLGAVRCPVCRQEVTILFQCFTESELNPPAGTDAEADRNTMIREINSYNRRFSGEPRPFLDYLRDFPILLRHLMNEFSSIGGIMLMMRLRIVLIAVAGFVYLLSPLDILPEAVFGLLGLMDDLFVILVICVYISMIYRNYIASRD